MSLFQRFAEPSAATVRILRFPGVPGALPACETETVFPATVNVALRAVPGFVMTA
jgi:hypothetical protein